jgi:hypothetical protein
LIPRPQVTPRTAPATLANYDRGVPRKITLPDPRTLSATVSDFGLPLSVSDPLGYATMAYEELHPRAGAGVLPRLGPRGHGARQARHCQCAACNSGSSM